MGVGCTLDLGQIGLRLWAHTSASSTISEVGVSCYSSLRRKRFAPNRQTDCTDDSDTE